MEQKYTQRLIVLIAFITLGLFLVYQFSYQEKKTNNSFVPSGMTEKVILAGGCFWSLESAFEKLPGVISVVSGYAGGEGENPTYRDYAERGFREVVEVTYDPQVLEFNILVEYLIRHSDPTDSKGSFYDRGEEYAPAVYFATDQEKETAYKVIRAIDEKKIFSAPLAVAILPEVRFWSAEAYHQDYALRNPVRYNLYRQASGRDAFFQKYWGENNFPTELSPKSL